MICLDTNTVIAAINLRPLVVRSILELQLASGIVAGIPTIVLFELWFGARKSVRKEASRAALKTFLTLDVTVWPFDAEDSEEAGEIRAALASAGTPIGPYDVLIAAQARRRGATLVTANVREFSRVAGLHVVDWTAAGSAG